MTLRTLNGLMSVMSNTTAHNADTVSSKWYHFSCECLKALSKEIVF